MGVFLGEITSRVFDLKVWTFADIHLVQSVHVFSLEKFQIKLLL